MPSCRGHTSWVRQAWAHTAGSGLPRAPAWVLGCNPLLAETAATWPVRRPGRFMSTIQADIDFLLSKLESESPDSAEQTQALANFFSTFDGEVRSTPTRQWFTSWQ
jgi:hypothetical protein